ncbi:MAG: hypothetical protein JRN29_05490 [Nitrososphaerota archaeon]|nr:hypothetical protein [Nitrososphaerota archaeon]
MSLLAFADNIQLVTLFIVVLSAYNVLKQKQGYYDYVRKLLFMVHVFFGGILVLELVRVSNGGGLFMTIYTMANTTFVLIDVALLTLVALTVYYRPTGASGRGMFVEMLRNRVNAPILVTFMGYIGFTDLYLFVYRPYDVQQFVSIIGTPILNSQFDPQYLFLLFMVLVVFMAYPSALLLMASRKVNEAAVRNSLMLLPVIWSSIGVELLVFNGYLLNSGYDFTPVGYLIAAVAFGLTGLIFRNASRLAGIFKPVEPSARIPVRSGFSTLVGGEENVYGRESLLEVDPDVPYEETVKEFVLESLSKDKPVFVFTAKGSRVYSALAGVQGIRTYVLTTKVSYPRQVEQSHEVLVPQNDQAVLLDILGKTVGSANVPEASIVLDSITDMIVYWGYETCYKFIKEANEILNERRVTSIFLMLLRSHDEGTLSTTKSLFTNHMLLDGLGLRLARGSSRPGQK